jgi:Fe-S cluster biosynthesis and repair protein YggX
MHTTIGMSEKRLNGFKSTHRRACQNCEISLEDFYFQEKEVIKR